jgi:hypothetical protein
MHIPRICGRIIERAKLKQAERNRFLDHSLYNKFHMSVLRAKLDLRGENLKNQQLEE